MDKEQARFILQSFRPDGADAPDPDFAEALSCAAQDRELGEWLAKERSQDSEFAKALAVVEIPDDIRENILSVLRGESAHEEDVQFDADMMDAVTSVRVPEGLREEILAAMKVEHGREDTVKDAPRRVGKWLNAAAVAAAIVLGAFVAVEFGHWSGESGVAQVSPQTVERTAIRLVSGEFSLDAPSPGFENVAAFIKGNDLPILTKEDLPAGLAEIEPLGCKLLSVGETTASLVCFSKEGLGTVHVVVLRRDDLEGSLPELDEVIDRDCRQCSVTLVSSTAWQAGDRAFFLLAKVDPKELREVF